MTEKEHLYDWVIAALVSQVWGSALFQQDFVSVIEKNLYLRSADEISRSPADTLQQTRQSTAQGPVHKLGCQKAAHNNITGTKSQKPKRWRHPRICVFQLPQRHTEFTYCQISASAFSVALRQRPYKCCVQHPRKPQVLTKSIVNYQTVNQQNHHPHFEV